jgi:hypothetical protein
LIDGLHHWFQDTPSALVPRFPWYETLVEHQSSIDWDQTIFGRWSTVWVTHQSSYHPRQKILLTPTSHYTGWTSRIITLIWIHCHTAWLDRNQALHGHNQQTKNLPDCVTPCSAFDFNMISDTNVPSVLRGPLISRTKPNTTRELARAERSHNSSPCCLPSAHHPHPSTTQHQAFHLHHLTFHVRFHPFCTNPLPIEKFC